MFKFFPPLYPDEYFYSWISRYHTYSGNLLLQQTKNDLFGVNNRDATYVALLKNLNIFCSKLPPEWDITPQYISNNHTEFPVYYSLKGIIYNENYQNIITAGYYNRNHFTDFNLKVCPECYKEQKEKYGEAYFIKYHQDSNVIFCYKHTLPLMTCKHKLTCRNFYDLNSLSLEKDFENSSAVNLFSDKWLQIANLYKNILDGQLVDLNLTHIKALHIEILEKKGYKSGSHTNLLKLKEDFTQFYGLNFLKEVECEIGIDINKSWLGYIFSKYGMVNLTKHLLIILFLYGSISKLKKYASNQIDDNKSDEFINAILNSTKIKTSLLKQLHCSLNVAYQKSKQYGIADAFLEKMQGYFDKENVNRCKAVIENYVLSYNGRLTLLMLSRALSGEYKIVQAWDKDWLINLINKKNSGLFK